MMLTIPICPSMASFAAYLCFASGQTGEEGARPKKVVMKDRPLQITFLLWGVMVLIIFYLVPRT
jgi:hypothetical protein